MIVGEPLSRFGGWRVWQPVPRVSLHGHATTRLRAFYECGRREETTHGPEFNVTKPSTESDQGKEVWRDGHSGSSLARDVSI
jgi:hypothetical protein